MHGGVRKLRTPVRLEYRKPGNKTVGKPEDLQVSPEDRSRVTRLEEKVKVK